jgi:hypothetical protein
MDMGSADKLWVVIIFLWRYGKESEVRNQYKRDKFITEFSSLKRSNKNQVMSLCTILLFSDVMKCLVHYITT